MERIDPLLSSVRCFDSLFVIILLWLFVANVPSIINNSVNVQSLDFNKTLHIETQRCSLNIYNFLASKNRTWRNALEYGIARSSIQIDNERLLKDAEERRKLKLFKSCGCQK